MAHEPSIGAPEHPGQTPKLSESQPAAVLNPEVALQQSLAAAQKTQKTEKIANRIPDVKKSAYILLGLILFSAAQFLAMDGVIISMLGSQQHNSSFLASNILSWTAGTICALILLTTKSTKAAKRVLFVVGIALLYFSVTDILVVNLIGLVIDGFLVGWTYRLYQSVEALEI